MPRRDGESTMEYLGRNLDAVGLHDMARRARLGHFDDYFCPDDVNDGMNINRLVAELRMQARVQVNSTSRMMINELAEMAIDGEFDGTKEESDRWAKSPDGQRVFNELLGNMTDKDAQETLKKLFGGDK